MATNINFGWEFAPGFYGAYLKELPPNREIVDIPHAPVETPLNYFDEKSYQGVFTYAKEVDLPALGDNEAAIITFDGVMLRLTLYVNGELIGSYISGWVPVSADISGALRKGRNRIVAVVDSREDPKVPPFGGQVDYLTFAGIYRPVRLEILPKTYVKGIKTSAHKDGSLKVEAVLSRDDPGAKVSYTLSYKGEKVLESDAPESKVDNPHLWSPESPNLYDLSVKAESPSGIHEKSIRIGFRDIRWTADGGFFINGEPLKLRGLNRHQNYPYVGPALPKAAQEDDADIIRMKSACNVVRTSHYPQSEDFLNRCDEIGLMAIDEIPGWQHIDKDPAWREAAFYFLKAMVAKERNHPCLIAYGTRIDESMDDDELYSKLIDYVHKEDKDRPTIGVRFIRDSKCLEDIYGYNDFSHHGDNPGLIGKKAVKGSKGHPILITEHNGHMFPIKSYDCPDRRVSNCLRHLRVMDAAYGEKDISGAIGWCAFDYNTHPDFGSGDHICYHGVYDIMRNPKESAFAYASQKDPEDGLVLEVANPPIFGDNDESIQTLPLLLTNCDYADFYVSGEKTGRFHPDRKGFPNLPHPPIFLDYIGDRFNEPDIPKRHRKKIKEALELVASVGLSHIKKSQLIRYLPAIIGSHLTFADLNRLYNKYCSNWGDKTKEYRVVGYAKIGDETKTVERTFGPSLSFHYDIEATKDELVNDETYDVARVSMTYRDSYGAKATYAFHPISFETEGPIEVIGPESISLIGGAASVYVRSLRTDKPEKATLTIKTPSGDEKVSFRVR
jgi:beta-galactosidase